MSDISIVVSSNTSSVAINTGVLSAPATTNASDLTSGTLPDARLSAAVPILVGGLIPSGLLPSYVGDVVEYANLAAFPATGEAGKIFVDIATRKIYRWSGSVYVEINVAPVQSVSGRTGAVTLTNADVGLGSVNNTSDASKPVSTDTQTALDLKAPLLSPALTGTPTAITANPDTASTQLATCGFVLGQAGNNSPQMDGSTYVGMSSRYARQDHVHPTDTSLAPKASPTFTGTVTIPIGANIAGYAQTSSPSFSGNPLATTASTDDTSTRIATCQYVTGQAGVSTPLVDGSATIGISLRYARQDHVHPTNSNLAIIDSPSFTGNPLAPTAPTDDYSTQIATCQFVTGQAGNDSPQVDGSAYAGSSLRYARQDHTHPTNSNLAMLNSPALTGFPTAPTASIATNTTQIATTQFVRAEVAALVGTTASTLDTLGELAAAIGSDASFSTTIATSIGLKAPLASPTFTGTVTIPSGASISGFAPLSSPAFTSLPTAPTGTADISTTQIATQAFVIGQAGTASPLMNSAYTSGTSSRYSRQDHVHPNDTTKANIGSPTFTGTVSGITKTMVGLGSVDNTADTAKPVSTATQTALNLKANLASPTFSGTVGIGNIAANISLYNAKTVTGGTTAYGYLQQGYIQTDVTNAAALMQVQLNTVANCSLIQVLHYTCSAGTIGAGTAITYQFGYNVGALDQATNNIGFNSGMNISATGKTNWAINCSGTAPVAFNGKAGVGGPPTTTGAVLQVTGNTIQLTTARTPASASATGNVGEICWDASYLYVCIATNTWKRSLISTW